jgi:hypothetical protein
MVQSLDFYPLLVTPSGTDSLPLLLPPRRGAVEFVPIVFSMHPVSSRPHSTPSHD